MSDNAFETGEIQSLLQEAKSLHERGYMDKVVYRGADPFDRRASGYLYRVSGQTWWSWWNEGVVLSMLESGRRERIHIVSDADAEMLKPFMDRSEPDFCGRALPKPKGDAKLIKVAHDGEWLVQDDEVRQYVTDTFAEMKQIVAEVKAAKEQACAEKIADRAMRKAKAQDRRECEARSAIQDLRGSQ